MWPSRGLEQKLAQNTRSKAVRAITHFCDPIHCVSLQYSDNCYRQFYVRRTDAQWWKTSGWVMKKVRPTSGTVLCIGDEAVRLNLRCSFLREHGWLVLSAGAAHEGIIRFGREMVDVAILEFDDVAQAALVAGELKRLRPQLRIILVAAEDHVLPDATAQCTDLVVPASDQSVLLCALESLRADPPPPK